MPDVILTNLIDKFLTAPESLSSAEEAMVRGYIGAASRNAELDVVVGPYTLIAGDSGKFKRITSGDVIIPVGLLDGFHCGIIFDSESSVIVLASGVVSLGGEVSPLETDGAGSVISVLRTSTNQFAIGGGINASEFGEMRDYAVTQCLRGNVKAPTGSFTRQWASPGPLYDSYGQFPADGCYVALGLAEIGDYSSAWSILLTYGDHQDGTSGFVPRYITSAGTNDGATNASTSQWPMLAHTAWELYQKSGDLTNLTAVYSSLKKFYGWWETNRQDASGLAFWGVESSITTESQIRILGMAEAAMDRFGFANNDALTRGSLLSGVGRGHEHCCPVLNALLVMESRAISQIAGALSNSSDQATYLAKTTTRITKVNALMWDAEQGWYQRVVRLDQAINRTTVQSLSGTTLILTNAGGSFTIIPAGELLVFSNGATAQAAVNPSRLDGNWQVNQPADADSLRTITLLTAPSGVTNGTAVIGRPFAYFKAFPDAALVLDAGIPQSGDGRALKIANNVYSAYDGTQVDTTRATFFSLSYRGFSHQKSQWVRWYVNGSGLSQLGTIIQMNDSSSTIYFSYRLPNSDDFGLQAAVPGLRNMIFDSIPNEIPSHYRPVAPVVCFQRSGAGSPTMTLNSYEATYNNKVALTPATAFSAPAGSGTPILTTGGTYEGPGYVVGEVNIGCTGAVYIFSVALNSQPIGSVFSTDYGMLTTSRFGGQCYFKSPSNPNKFEQDDTYWMPGIWAHFQYHFVRGLKAYSDHRYLSHGKKFLSGWKKNFDATGDIPEYITPRGDPRGSNKYGWSGAAIVLSIAQIR